MARKGEKRGRACVVVLGDIGRSPRMQYHALSLARQASLEVDIVAYGGSEPHSAVLEHQSIHIHKMPQWPAFPRGLPSILKPFVLLLKPVVQFIVLLWYLCVKISAPDVFLVQNPPSVPTLVAVKWASWLRQSAFIVDWHNFGYTLLALSLGRSSRFVAIYRWVEWQFGRMADGSLCVTRAMQHELAQNWGIKATVLYDQPPEFFHPASLEEQHKLFYRLDKNLRQPLGVEDCTSTGIGEVVNKDMQETLFTTLVGADIASKPNRPALIVSSTSWTPDEDFGILLEAAVMYDRRVAAILNEDDSKKEEVLWKEMQSGKQYLYPRLLFVITGKGPEKEKYEEKIRRLKLKRVAFRTAWLSAEDYPLLLGSADLGVCLHTSSPQLLSYSLEEVMARVGFYLDMGINDKDFGTMVFDYPRVLGYYTLDEMNQKVNYLKEFGLSTEDVGKLLAFRPQLMGCGIEERWKPLAKYLYYLGITRDGMRRMLTIKPIIFCADLEKTIVPKVKFFQDIGIRDDAIGKMLVKFPPLLTYSLYKKIRPVVIFLITKAGVSDRDIGKVIALGPELLGCNIVHKLEVNVKYFRSLGIHLSTLGEMIADFPMLLRYNTDVLRPKYRYLRRTMVRPLRDLIEFPRFFSYSLEGRIIPRHKILLENHINLKLRYMLASTDAEFDKRVKNIVERRQRFESGITNEDFSNSQLSEDDESPVKRIMLDDAETEAESTMFDDTVIEAESTVFDDTESETESIMFNDTESEAESTMFHDTESEAES